MGSLTPRPPNTRSNDTTLVPVQEIGVAMSRQVLGSGINQSSTMIMIIRVVESNHARKENETVAEKRTSARDPMEPLVKFVGIARNPAAINSTRMDSTRLDSTRFDNEDSFKPRSWRCRLVVADRIRGLFYLSYCF